MKKISVIASPKGNFLLGHLWQISRDPLTFFSRCASDYGDLVPLRFGSITSVFLNHPDLIKEAFSQQNRIFMRKGYIFHKVGSSLLGDGLFLSEGNFYRHQRDLAKPAFHQKKIDTYGEVMVAKTELMLATWKAGEVRNVYQDYVNLTQSIIAETLFGARLNSVEASHVTEALDTMMATFSEEIKTLLLLPNWIPTRNRRRFKSAIKQLDQVVYKLITTRRIQADNQGNFLDLLLQADNQGNLANTHRQLRDEVINLFLAGHETTAITLTWASWLLSRYPGVTQTLVTELRSVLVGRTPTVADLPQLPYTRSVALEALRLYPTVWSMSRVALEDTKLAGYPIKKGSSVIACQWTAHRNPEFFPNPESFNPERWLDGLADRLPLGAYFPFSLGARVCLGKAFGMMELTLLLATIAQQFQFRSRPYQLVKISPSLTLRPKNGMSLMITN